MKKESLIGQTFAEKFEVTGFLGEGGMGRIYLANELGADRQIALKVLHQHLGGEAEVVKRFDREMRAAASVQHPNSVRVYEYGDFEGRLYLSMEFVDGDSLGEALLDDAPFPAERVAYIGRQIAAALGAAHAQGIIHRDLKPDNVMLADPGVKDTVKVCDFGLARFVGGESEFGADDDGLEASEFQTAIGVRVGTPHYMSPEYIGEFRADHRADLYALGVLMFEMSTGRPPFDGRPYEVLDAHVVKAPPKPSSVCSEVPPWLDAIILKLLEKKPVDRYQVAEEVLVKLERDRGETLDDEEDKAVRLATEDQPTEQVDKDLAAPLEIPEEASSLTNVAIIAIGALAALAVLAAFAVIIGAVVLVVLPMM